MPAHRATEIVARLRMWCGTSEPSYIAVMYALVARAMRGLIAVLTVWCIGCSSFESMLESWMSEDGSASASCMGGEGKSASDTKSANIAVKSAAVPGIQVGCGCADCIAAEPVVLSLIGAQQATPQAPVGPVPAFLGIAREPQVPPPRA